jgi:hypothetical protein
VLTSNSANVNIAELIYVKARSARRNSADFGIFIGIFFLRIANYRRVDGTAENFGDWQCHCSGIEEKSLKGPTANDLEEKV